jgi:glycosyltransferase involved in cell wall biosynthesis
MPRVDAEITPAALYPYRVAPRISVIVAVYNPGPHFDDLIDSFLRQSLPPDQFEVLLCDDGSNAETLARLDAVTAEHPHLKVLKLEHSGWPGTPRNVGIDTAAGKYVFFCDHDDRMGHEALERLANYADANSSDVVVGKLVGVGRALPRGMFRRNIPKAVLGQDPLLDILTPHKLFRTEFIREHGIRFPDGRVRLEDHMFVMKAYFAADVVSILADYPCYYWTKRTDQPSASADLIDPDYYFRFLEVVLDIVENNVPSGPARHALLQHWYRLKVLKRLSGRRMLRYTEEYRTNFLDVVRPMVQKRFPLEVDPYLQFPMRVRSELLRANRVDDMLALVQAELGLRASAHVTSIAWDANRRLRIEVEAKVLSEDGSELTFEPIPVGAAAGVTGADQVGTSSTTRWRWRAPQPFGAVELPDEVLDASRDLARSSIDVFVRARHDGADYYQPVESSTTPTGPGVLRSTVVVDPRSARAGRAVTMFSDLVVQVNYAGWSFGTALRIDAAVLEAEELKKARTIGKRVFTLGVRGGDRLFLRADPLGQKPKPAQTPMPVVEDGRSPVIREARRFAGRVRRRLLRVLR